LANPSWGFPSELKDDTYAVDVVGSLVSKTLINKRNIVKAAVRCQSLDLGLMIHVSLVDSGLAWLRSGRRGHSPSGRTQHCAAGGRHFRETQGQIYPP
jgi:hypothetical protein